MDAPFPNMDAARAGAEGVLWPQPVDFFSDLDIAPPMLRREHIPDGLWSFVSDTSERMGVDPTGVALGCLVSSATVISEDWKIQPKRHDYTWTENARLWGAILGDPSILKTPLIRECTRPIDKLEAEARKTHQEDMKLYKAELAVWKKSDMSTPEPVPPAMSRYMIEGATIEAISEVLRDDGRFCAPSGKVLSRQGEMGEFFANLDRYAAGGKGGGDRGAYLRLWDGGRFTMDRVGRGAFAILNWSACFFGGIQPGPIQQIAKASADDGMLHRLLFVVPGSQGVGKDRVPDQVSIERYEAIIRALAAFHPAIAPGKEYPDHVVFHRDAHQHREEIDTLARALAAMPDTSRRLVSALGKIPGQFARLCLTFHMINIVDGKLSGTITPSLEVVPEETAMRVAALLHDVLIPHLLRAHAVMFSTAQTTHAQWIAGYILANKMDRITSRDVTRAYRALRPPECKNELADVMASLVTVGWLEPIVPRNLAKPVWSWDVNPNAHTLFADRAEQERRAREQAKADIAENVAVFRRSYRRTQA